MTTELGFVVIFFSSFFAEVGRTCLFSNSVKVNVMVVKAKPKIKEVFINGSNTS